TDWEGDKSTETQTRTVVVSDDDTAAPVITLGGSTGAENDGQNQHFTWSVSEASGFSAYSVVIKKGATTIFSTTDSTMLTGDIDFNSWGLGTYTIEIAATDNDTDWVGDQMNSSDSRTVTVTDD